MLSAVVALSPIGQCMHQASALEKIYLESYMYKCIVDFHMKVLYGIIASAKLSTVTTSIA